MKKLIPLVFIWLLLISYLAQAQETSSWINYGQKYVRVGVTTKGIQKVTFSQLQNAELDVNNANSDRLQLFHRGEEVAIVKIENEEVFFYGILNDGASDDLLFRPTSATPTNPNVNKRYSRYSGEGAYFFTIGSAQGKRVTTSSAPTNNELQSLTWHWEQNTVLDTTQYSNNPANNGLKPSTMQSYFKDGESLTSAPIVGTGSKNVAISLVNRYTETFHSPRLEYMVNGRVEGITSNFTIKTIENNRLIVSQSIQGFKGIKDTFNNFTSDDLTTSNVTLKFEGTTSSSRFSFTYAFLEYPQVSKLVGVRKHFYYEASNNPVDKITIGDVTNPSFTLLDVSNSLDPKTIGNYSLNSNVLTAFIPRVANSKSILFLSTSPIVPSNIRAVKFNRINPSDYNYIIITNKKLRTAVDNYANYRSSSQGGSYNVLVMDILDIYSQFNYGEPSPIAIKQFAKHMLSDNSINHKNLFLIGWGVSYHVRVPRELRGNMSRGLFPDNSLIDYDHIPTIGYPGSDVLLVDNIGNNNKQNVPGIGIGRLPAVTPEQVSVYLEKVKEYEKPSTDIAWKKNVLSVSGGGKNGVGEIISIRNKLDQLNSTFTTASYLGGNLNRISKSTDDFNPAVPSVDIDISTEVNNGLGIIAFYGHGNEQRTDYNFGYISNNNAFIENNKFPFSYFVGCGVSNSFGGRYSLEASSGVRVPISTDWLLAAKKGSIATISNTYDTYLDPGHDLFVALNEYLLKQTNIITIGEAHKNAIRDLALKVTSSSEIGIANINQSLLQGDPALKLARVEKSEYITNLNDGLFVTSGDPTLTIGESSDNKLGIIVQNDGRYDRSLTNLPYRVKLFYKSGSVSSVDLNMPNVALLDTHYVSLNSIEGGTNTRTLSLSDLNRIEVTINPSNNPSEFYTDNNFSNLNFNWNYAQNVAVWTSTEAALPVNLISFNAIKEANAAALLWSTSEEINAKEYIVEKSVDANRWSNIGTVPAKGTSISLNTYQFTDYSTNEGTSFYRLKMIDLDNSFEYSLIRSVDFSNNVEISIYPNPASDEIRINSNLVKQATEVLIQDVTGRTIISISSLSDAIPISHLTPGMYILKIKSVTELERSFKFIKQ